MVTLYCFRPTSVDRGRLPFYIAREAFRGKQQAPEAGKQMGSGGPRGLQNRRPLYAVVGSIPASSGYGKSLFLHPSSFPPAGRRSNKTMVPPVESDSDRGNGFFYPGRTAKTGAGNWVPGFLGRSGSSGGRGLLEATQKADPAGVERNWGDPPHQHG